MSGKRLAHLKVEFVISGYASNLVGTFGTNYTTSSLFSQTAVLTALTYNLKMIQDLRESWKPFNQQIFATPAVPKTSVNTDIQIISVKSETGLAIKHTVGEKTSVPQHGYWEFLKPGTQFVTHILAKEENLLPHIRKTFWIGKKLTLAKIVDIKIDKATVKTGNYTTIPVEILKPIPRQDLENMKKGTIKILEITNRSVIFEGTLSGMFAETSQREYIYLSQQAQKLLLQNFDLKHCSER